MFFFRLLLSTSFPGIPSKNTRAMYFRQRKSMSMKTKVYSFDRERRWIWRIREMKTKNTKNSHFIHTECMLAFIIVTMWDEVHVDELFGILMGYTAITLDTPIWSQNESRIRQRWTEDNCRICRRHDQLFSTSFILFNEQATIFRRIRCETSYKLPN